MKLWKRIYLLTLVIVTLCVNIGFLGIVYVTYNKMLEGEKESCQAEYIIMRQSLSKDVAIMEQSTPLSREFFARYLEVYNSYYDEDIALYGYIGNIPAGEEKGTYKVSEENGIFIVEEEQTVIYIVQSLDDSHSNYRVVMRKTLGDFDKIWDKLFWLYMIGGVVLSLGVSVILAVAVRVVMKPMDRLEEAVKQMEAGDWSARVDIEGKDELAKLGKQFNAMADSVEENIMKLEKQSEQKQELINNLAHEMNTPITSIQGFADYMQISSLSEEELAECLSFITRESKRLKEISTTLLSMVNIENKEEILHEEFSIRDLCKRLEKIYKKDMDEEEINLFIECNVERMRGNSILIESFLRNMITNGVRALDNRVNKEIKISIYRDDNKIKLHVEDNGCGIEEKHLENIFEPFYRVDKARSREYGGSGLGLPFCKKIVEMHNGNLQVESKVNEGTKFIATFTV